MQQKNRFVVRRCVEKYTPTRNNWSERLKMPHRFLPFLQKQENSKHCFFSLVFWWCRRKRKGRNLMQWILVATVSYTICHAEWSKECSFTLIHSWKSSDSDRLHQTHEFQRFFSSMLRSVVKNSFFGRNLPTWRNCSGLLGCLYVWWIIE